MDKPKYLDLNYLLIGFFNSDSYGPYSIYMLTKEKAFVDNSESWTQKRHSSEGYSFKGTELTSGKFEIIKDLFYNCPAEFLDKPFKSFYTTGNKNEDKLIVEISGANFKKSITIDTYDIETEDLEPNLRDFRILAEKKLKDLKASI